MKITILRITVSLCALVAVVVHLLIPALKLDPIALALIVIGFLPWLAPIFKSIEIPGVGKIEMQEIEKVQEKAVEIGIATVPSIVPSSPIKQEATVKYTYEFLQGVDPILAFAGLRIELEKKLREVAELKQIHLPKQGMTGVLRELQRSNALSENEISILRDLIPILNRAAHGESIEPMAAAWVKAIGRGVLEELDLKLYQPTTNRTISPST